MSTQSLWLVRHGERADVDPAWAATTDRPHDPPLTSLGLKQADESARKVESERIHRIIASPAIRCVQTADAIATALDLDICIEPAVSEWKNGDWFGSRRPDWLSAEELAEKHESVDTTYVPLAVPEVFPETFQNLYQRMNGFFDQLLQRYTRENILIVGHAFVHATGNEILTKTGNDKSAFFCSISKLVKAEPPHLCAGLNLSKANMWQAEYFADTTHLKRLPRSVAEQPLTSGNDYTSGDSIKSSLLYRNP